jgi:hypothetical protein
VRPATGNQHMARHGAIDAVLVFRPPRDDLPGHPQRLANGREIVITFGQPEPPGLTGHGAAPVQD